MHIRNVLLSIVAIMLLFTGCETALDEAVEYAKNGDGRFPVFTAFTVASKGSMYACAVNNLVKTDKTVLCVIPYGEPLNDLTFAFETTEKAQMFIEKNRQYSGESAYDFTNPVVAMLKDWGGEETFYTITVQNRPPNGVIPKVTSYSILLNGLEYKCFIDEEKKTITGSVPYGTDRSALVATFQTTENPDVSIDGIDQVSGLNENDFTVTRKLKLKDYEDEVNEYIVKIAIAPNTEALIYSFSATIDATEYVSQVKTDTIITYVPYGTALKNTKLSYIVSDFATTKLQDIVLYSGDQIDLSTDQLLKIYPQDGGIPKSYSLIVKYLPNTAALFSSFMLLSGGVYYNCAINTNQITVSVPYGTDKQHMVATFAASYGTKITVNGVDQESGQTINDFSGDVLYTVTSECGRYSQNYTVNVTTLPNTEAKITAFTLKVHTDGPDAEVNCTISDAVVLCKPPYNGDLTTGVAVFTLSQGATVSVAGVVQQNAATVNDFSGNDLVYLVTPQSGAQGSEYVVKIEVACNPNVQRPTEASVVNLNFGEGDFYSDEVKLTNACGNSIPYSYGQIIDSSLYDTGTTGSLVTGKALRMVVNGQNIFDPVNFNGGFVARAMNMQDVTKIPRGKEMYIDPETGKFSLPMPIYIHAFSSEDPDFSINSSQKIRYELTNPPYALNGIKANPVNTFYVKATENEIADMTTAQVELYPFGNEMLNLEKGTVAMIAAVTHHSNNEIYSRMGSVAFELENVFKVTIKRRIVFIPLVGSRNDYQIIVSIFENGAYGDKLVQNCLSNRIYITWDFSPENPDKIIKIYDAGVSLYNSTFSQSYGTAHKVKISLNASSSIKAPYALDNYIQASLYMLKIWHDRLAVDYGWLLYATDIIAKDALHPIYGSQENAYRVQSAKAGYFYNQN